MGKKLSEIQETVDKSVIEFVDFLKKNVDPDVYEFVINLSRQTNVFIFSGVIRNFFLGISEIRDLDIVISEHIDIYDLVDSSKIRLNSFGGYKISIGEINIDLWQVDKTWAIQYQKQFEFAFQDLHRFIPSTAFFNFSAILFDFNEGRFYYKNEFLSFLRDREVNYLYKPNANYALCVVNTLYYSDRYNLKISDKLKRLLINFYKKKLDYTEIQVKHFGQVLYTDESIKQRISKFTMEKRQVGDFLIGNLTEVFNRLNLNRDNGLYFTKENFWRVETSFPNRVNKLLGKEIQPDAFFCFDNKPLILFFENPEHKYKLHKAIWNFNEAPVVIIVENSIVEIFNGFEFDTNQELLKKLGRDEKLNDFTYLNLVTGKTWKEYQQGLLYKNRVDYKLLNNIKGVKRILEGGELDSKIINALIGKTIFVRYLIDRNVKINFDGNLRAWTNDEFCNLLSDSNSINAFWKYLEDEERGFNGNLFPLSNTDYQKVTTNDYLVIKKMLEGDEIDSTQHSLFQYYDFSIIPIEFISNVYELFIGGDNQKKEGAYYTPLFLVDYILKETVEKKICLDVLVNSADSLAYCKVLDPACGSGIFLVETLRKIIEKFIESNIVDIKSEEFKDKIVELARENIFGIDKDSNAVQVAIFSIYLTLLDYLEPPSIEKFKFPKLYNNNFFEADFFDEEASFNALLKNKGFHFIVGNPPWKGNGMDELGILYLKNRKQREKSLNKSYTIAINNNEIAEGFILRVSDFCDIDTKISFIVRSSSLYNLGYNDDFSLFRQYWLEEFYVDRVFELAPVRYEVFEKSNQPAVAPAAILFYRYANGKKTNSNRVEHLTIKPSRFFSLFKIFSLNRSDYKVVEQRMFKEYDWLWKVLVYGSYLDFNFIKRIKEGYTPIKKAISDKSRFVAGTGIQFSSTPIYDSQHLIDKPFIDSYGVEAFFTVPEKIARFDKLKVHRLRDERIFRAPMLLIREGIDMSTLRAKCAISFTDVLFKDSITSIKALDEDGVDILYNIMGVFNSYLFSYFAVNFFASIGIERERVKSSNKFQLPYLDLKATTLLKEIEELAKSMHELKHSPLNSFEINRLLIEKERKIDSLNDTINNNLGVNSVESALLDYAKEINLQLITGSNHHKDSLFKPLDFESEVLKQYISIFFNRFKDKFETENTRFVGTVWYSKQIIGVFFTIVDIDNYVMDIEWIDKQETDNEILSFLIQSSSSKITDKLFVQKDIRGFEKNGFYIFKPNEKKLWHQAIGYLDVNEFADAILKEGKKDGI